MKPKLFVIDIDGTLADCSHRLHLVPRKGKRDYDAFYRAAWLDTTTKICDKITEIVRRDYGADILVVTGRPEKEREATLNWLYNNVRFGQSFTLLMRKNGDMRKSHVVKRELLAESKFLLSEYDVAVFEDDEDCRKMYKELGAYVYIF
jgi:hydroxymethylpyrimidine pyrophosphatase-like HAD family hydrolase